MSKGLFVSATGTDVGKTYVTALLVKKLVQSGLAAGYYKAALSGAECQNGQLVPGDADYVRRVAGLKQTYSEMVSYVYENAVSPHLAARLEQLPVELSRIKKDFYSVAAAYDYVTMEGSGGIVCPIRYDEEQQLFLADIIQTLRLPVLLVADAGLGTLNSVVTTCEYMQNHNLPLAGIILNNYDENQFMHRDNRLMIEKLTGRPLLAVVAPGCTDLALAAADLAALYREID